jgi:predicted dehydrogenase
MNDQDKNPELEATSLESAESIETSEELATDRRGFLRGVAGVAGASLLLPQALQAAPTKSTAKPAAKGAVSKTAAQKKAADAKTGTSKPAVTNEVKQAAQNVPTKTAPKVQQVNVALIGAGSQGRNLLLNTLKIPGVNFVAVCDIWPYSLKYGTNILKKYGQTPKAYENYEDLLAQEKNLDAVIIATPDWMHAPQTVAALKAGKHVYCEKEMANTLEGAQDMVRAWRQSGKVCQIGHQRRSNPRYWHAYELIHKEGVLGRLTHAYGQWNRPKRLELGWPKGQEMSADALKRYGYGSMERFRNWRWYHQYSGGAIADLGSHQVDIFSWFLRTNPSHIMAAGSNTYYKQGEWYDHVMAIYDYDTKFTPEQGIVRSFYQVLNTTGWGGYYEVFMGDEGVLEISEDTKKGFLVREPGAKPKTWEDEASKIERMGMNAIALTVGETLNPMGRPKEQKLEAMSEKAPHQLHLENFFNAVRAGDPKKVTCDPDVAYETAVAVLRANDAVAAEKKITFNSGEFKVI